jgi:hypothetical protein
MVIPRSLRQEAGVPEDSLLKVDVVKKGQFLVTAQLTLDRPAVEGKNRKAVFRELAQAVAELRREAREKGVDKMSKAQINAAVAAARRDPKKSSIRPAK